jgi:hypothetical protein
VRTLILTTLLVFASAADGGKNGNEAEVALDAYLKCWVDTYSPLHNSMGTYPAIDAANAACKKQFQALASVTNLSKPGSIMIQVMEAAKSGSLDSLRAHP